MAIGFALIKNKKIIKMEKGVNLDVRDIANVMKNTSYDWAVFHTRLASMGTVCDQNCHPFIKNNIALAMNGTESSISFLSKVKEITDTEAILDTMTKYSLGLTALKNFSSIFMGFYNSKPFVVANNTISIKVLRNAKTKSLVFASVFPSKFKTNIYESTDSFIWNGGRLPSVLRKQKKEHYDPKFLNKYIYKDDLYGQCYLEALSEGGNEHEMPI